MGNSTAIKYPLIPFGISEMLFPYFRGHFFALFWPAQSRGNTRKAFQGVEMPICGDQIRF
jgi:hypothetical protein